MVTIIDGEIVPDDDPRAQAYRQRNRRPENSTRQQGSFDPRTAQRNMAPPGPGGLGAGSMFDQLNNKLIELGFPRWNLGENVIEPIVSVALILALVLFGVKGLLMVGVVYFLLRQTQR